MKYTFHFVRQGAVFYMVDEKQKMKRYANQRESLHPYMIITDDEKINKNSHVYCVGLTSGTNKLTDNMIPVLCSNDYITYIDTDKIYKFNYDQFTLRNYIGMLGDDVYSREDFLSMIQSLLVRNIIGIGKGVIENLEGIVRNYKDVFFRLHSGDGSVSLREKKISRKMEWEIANNDVESVNLAGNSVKEKEVIILDLSSIDISNFDPKDYIKINWMEITDTELKKLFKYLKSYPDETLRKEFKKKTIHSVHDLRYRAKKYLKQRGYIL